MKQIVFQKNQLNLKVEKSPLVIRIVFFIFSFLFFILPLLGLVFNLVEGNGIKFYSLFVIGIFSLMGFYLLRISLWNTFGEELIEISQNRIIYEANYKWFKDGKKEITFDAVNYLIKPVGDEYKGILIFESENSKIESVIQIPIIELEELVKNIRNIS